MKIWIYTTKEPLEYLKLDEEDEIKRSSINKAKKGDLILIYRGTPHSSIAHIFTAKTDPYEDKGYRDDWDTFIDLTNKIQLNTPLKLQEMKKDPILGNWGIIRKNFMGSFFEVPNKEVQEIKKLILDKNPELTREINELILNNHAYNKPNEITEANSRCINQNHRGRAHITRDICYLIHENTNINENSLSQLLIKNVGENNDYWKAYFQNCQKVNCTGYNLDSARSLGLIECDKLILTAKGQELVSKLEDNEIFTHYYGIGTKQFFFKLALEDEVIKTAMDILKERERLRFWSPTCKRTKRVIEKYHQENKKFICDENKHPECVDCDHDALNHINQTSLVLETLKKTGKRSGFVFWFTSRVIPIHLTGQDPAYNGQNIYWDKNEAALIDSESENIRNPWVFSVNKYNFGILTDDDITWNSALDVKKDDLILFYRGEPESAITDIFIAKTDPYDDAETKDAISGKAVDLQRQAKIIVPISWETLKNNPILKEWVGVKMHFGKSHFKTSEEVWNELKRLILEKNPELESIIGEPLTNSITDYLRKIFGSYVKARDDKERVKGHELSKLFNIDFPRILKTIANRPEISSYKHDYETASGYHARGRFIKFPWIILYDKNIEEKDENDDLRYDFYVLYIFDENMDGLYLSLNIRWGYANHIFDKNPDWNKNIKDEYLKSCTSKVRENLVKNLEIPLEFQEDINNSHWWTTTILGKYYDAKNLPPENKLQNDLIRILKIYNFLIEELGVPKPYKIIQALYQEYKDTFLLNQEGITHSKKYDLERKKVEKYFEMIENDKEAIKNIEDPPINHLLPIKEPAIAPVAVGDIRAYGYKDEDLPDLTAALCELILNLIDSDDKEIQKELINDFKNGKYKKGFQTAMFTPTLYYLKPDFWFINRKTVANYGLLSEILGENDQISGNLVEYIENNDKLHRLVEKLSNYIPDLNFESFDEFSHWMCENSLGNYACNRKKFEKWLNKMFPTDDKKGIDAPFSDNFFQYLEEKGYYFKPELVENFLLSLKIKPFVILTGNAGTGKTKLAQLFAQYISGLDPSQYEIIPVGANWTENRHIVGYYNVISNKYQKTAALELILRANDSKKPFFLILDEMNLSHVERYFSDFLSSMESGEPMPLINRQLDDIDDMDLSLNVPEKLYIPSNLFIVGTVNVDETTYMFSPKVLDRANTMEFTTQSAKEFMLNSFNSSIPDTDYTYLQNPLSDIHVRDYSINELKELFIKIKTEDDHSLWDVLADEMDSLSDILKDAGFDFGFRTITEIIRFMNVSWIYDGENDQWINWRRFFDTQIYQKILPKVHGSHRELDSVLRKLFNHCYNGDFEDETWFTANLDEDKLLYPDSARKLQMMGKILQEKRYVSFTG